ncbi:hypothetical protein BH10PSE13_BH10PSE13_25790 [soil metagenome]
MTRSLDLVPLDLFPTAPLALALAGETKRGEPLKNNLLRICSREGGV